MALSPVAVRGVVLMRGYQKTLPEQWQDADGFFHCSDGGSLDAEGYLHWTGRIDDLIKTGGANVSPLEIERALESFAPLRAARAVAVPHPTLGQAIVLCAVRGALVAWSGVLNLPPMTCVILLTCGRSTNDAG